MSGVVQQPERVFLMGTIRLFDPDPTATPDEVRALYAVNYPALEQATVEGPNLSGDAVEYSFVAPPAKTKG